VLAPGLYEADDAEPKPGTEGNTISQMLTWIKNNGTADTPYTLVLGEDETITTALPTIGNPSGITNTLNKNNITIILQTFGTPVTITKGGNFALFTITGTNSTDAPKLILDSGITLKGLETGTNTSAVVSVGAYGYLEMRDGSRITGNVSTTGSGVSILANGEFKMLGGTIDSNKATGNAASGGGVKNAGTFTMLGGEIYNNEVGNTTGGTYPAGGGVYISGTNARFEMGGGKIHDNKALSAPSRTGYDALGGGVDVYGGTFRMYDADPVNPPEIRNNEARFGGGLGSEQNSTSTISIEGGIIAGNRASRGGAAVCLTKGTFTKTGGVIYGISAGTNSNYAADTLATNPHQHDGTATVHAIQTCSTYSSSAVIYLYYRDNTHEGDGLAYSVTNPGEQTGFTAE
jgi:hypothetical protein